MQNKKKEAGRSLYIGRTNERASTNLLLGTEKLGMEIMEIALFTHLGLLLGQRTACLFFFVLHGG
jgi:hypothetical protein